MRDRTTGNQAMMSALWPWQKIDLSWVKISDPWEICNPQRSDALQLTQGDAYSLHGNSGDVTPLTLCFLFPQFSVIVVSSVVFPSSSFSSSFSVAFLLSLQSPSFLNHRICISGEGYLKLTPWNRVLLEKLVKKFPRFIELEGSLPCSQEPVHTFPAYFPNIRSNIILLSTSRSSEWSLPYG
jgi:hypothetical protein